LPCHLSRLACFRAYGSSTQLPRCLQGSIPGPWLAHTRAGIPPARICGIAGRSSTPHPLSAALGALAKPIHRRDFWYLFATFFICGFTTNGLVRAHLIALCADHGIAEVGAAGLLAMMGVFDLIGTTASGWLTHRIDPRKLLFMYYSLRGTALVYLPYSNFSLTSLSMFAVFYGLDWIATVLRTLRLTTEAFRETAAAMVFGWILAGHQLGAACAAFLAAYRRTLQGDYVDAVVFTGSAGISTAALALLIGRHGAASARAPPARSGGGGHRQRRGNTLLATNSPLIGISTRASRNRRSQHL